METTTITHQYGMAPEQVAVDLLLAAFSAIGAVQARNDLETGVLAAAQGSLNEAYKGIRSIHPDAVI